MSKKHQVGHDSHHILFYRAEWDKGYKALLRRAFVYYIPQDLHQKLHATVEKVSPITEAEAKYMWDKYQELKRPLDVLGAYSWLIANGPNVFFKEAILSQYRLLSLYLR